MEGAWIILALLALMLVVRVKNSRKRVDEAAENENISSSGQTIACPTCGATAHVSGERWECGYCGDCGAVRQSKK